MPDQAELQAMRIAAGLTVDAATAPIIWDYADTSDPYGDFPFNPAEACIGREIPAGGNHGDILLRHA